MNDTELREEISDRVQKMLNELVPFPRKPFYFGDCIDDLVALVANHSASVEREAYQRGRIDEAKTCEQAKRHQLTNQEVDSDTTGEA